jgi:multiple sugar transport system permease protein
MGVLSMVTEGITQSRPFLRSLHARYRFISRWSQIIIALILVAGATATLYPFLWMIFSAFKSVPDALRVPPRLLPEVWTLEAFQTVFGHRVNLLRGYLNSFFVTIVVLVSTLFTSSLGGYVFTRLNFPGRRVVFYFVLATTMVPGMTLMIPRYILFYKLQLLNTYWPLWLSALFSAFGIFLWGQFILSIPVELCDSAKIDGASDFSVYHQIILPLCKPVAAIQTIMIFLATFNDFLTPLLYLNDESKFTLPLLLRIVASRFGDYQQAINIVMAASLLITLPSLVVFIIFRRYIIHGIALTGMAGT